MIVLGIPGDAHPCIPQVCAEVPLPPPSSGSRCVCSSFSRQHEVFNTKGHRQRATLEVKTCVVVVVLDAIKSVCIITSLKHALSYQLIKTVQTWRRGPAQNPEIIPPQFCTEQEHVPHHPDHLASSCDHE